MILITIQLLLQQKTHRLTTTHVEIYDRTPRGYILLFSKLYNISNKILLYLE